MENSQVDVLKLLQGLPPLPEPVARPVLVVVSGLPGTGKSRFARALAPRLPAAVLESDALRKRLFPQPTHGPEESVRLFAACHALAERLLRQGRSVILDATSLLERHREPLYHIADRTGAKLILVWVEAPPEVVRQRLARRREGDSPEDNSEAGWAVYERMRPQAEPIRRRHFVVDTSRDITSALAKILREARR